jgi:hypothetical protein
MNCVQDTVIPLVTSFCNYVVWLQEPEERTMTDLKLIEGFRLCNWHTGVWGHLLKWQVIKDSQTVNYEEAGCLWESSEGEVSSRFSAWFVEVIFRNFVHHHLYWWTSEVMIRWCNCSSGGIAPPPPPPNCHFLSDFFIFCICFVNVNMSLLLVRTAYLEHPTYFNNALMGKSVLTTVSPGTTHGVMTAFDMTTYVRYRFITRSWTVQGNNKQQEHQHSFIEFPKISSILYRIIRWYDLQELLLWIKKRILTPFALDRSYIGTRTDTTQQSGQTPDKEVDITHVTVCQLLHWNRSDWNVVSQQQPTVWPNKEGLFRADSLARQLPQFA